MTVKMMMTMMAMQNIYLSIKCRSSTKQWEGVTIQPNNCIPRNS